MIRIFWTCKNGLYTRAVEGILKDNGIHVAGICKRPNEAISFFEKTKADIVIMDLSWGWQNESGVDLLNGFLKRDPGTKIILVTSCYEATVAPKLKDIGASGYFFRNDDIRNIIDCIRRVYQYGNAFKEAL